MRRLAVDFRAVDFDITSGTGFDASNHSMADLVDDYVHITYFSDPLAGNNIVGNHPLIPVAVMYHKFLAADLVVGVKELHGQVPSAYSLAQNYPNPFNPSTIIRYSVPTTSFVTLKVYDVLGREVATLVNQEQGPGTYSADFNATNVSNGIYFYRLVVSGANPTQAGNFTDVKKMMLLK